MENKQDKIINQYYKIIGSDLKIMVKNIENGIKLTQSNYGEYLKLITSLSDEIPSNLVGKLLIKAGGNIQGINAALKIING
tara:strand:+ start:324 stop:566 length:243 start_codon:yes stop_codon:yes gene_type:complete